MTEFVKILGPDRKRANIFEISERSEDPCCRLNNGLYGLDNVGEPQVIPSEFQSEPTNANQLKTAAPVIGESTLGQA